jgi:NAD(P)-dependent dehydrogenase (short-subunit alcohol dehydrogenase family)
MPEMPNHPPQQLALRQTKPIYLQRYKPVAALSPQKHRNRFMNHHPALAPGRVAVITGAASGIGRAAALRFAGMGLKICLADLPSDALDSAATAAIAASKLGAAGVLAVPTDVSALDQVQALADKVFEAFGEVGILMNNAATGASAGPWDNIEIWRRLLEINLFGVINGVQVFTPRMAAQGTECAIINTGSKQGITCPPGNTAYNVSKAGVKVLTEALAHGLRNTDGGKITAHLLVPGSTFTGMTAGNHKEKPSGAWSADQVVDMLVEGMGNGDFYIICPDNEVTREIDNKRILWAAQDITNNRPALSRWHPDYKDAFARFLES